MTIATVGLAHDLFRPDGSPIMSQACYARLAEAGLQEKRLPPLKRYGAGDLAGVDALIVRQTAVTEAAIAGAPTLRVVARFGAGYDRVDVPAAERHGVMVATVPNAVTEPMAVANITFLLSLAGQVRQLDSLTREGRWTERATIGTIAPGGRIVGLVGLGRIGGRTAELARALGFEVMACTASPRESTAEVTIAPFETILETADFVVAACPLTPSTKGLFNAAAFARMKPGAFFVNTARGGLVDEAALVAALTTGSLRGAGLDVFAEEPIAPDHPLLSLPNVVLTPHAAGTSDGMINGCWDGCLDAVLAVRAGERPESVVSNN